MSELSTKQDYLNEIEKWNIDSEVKKQTIKWTKPDIVSFYEQYKPRDDNVKVVIPLENVLVDEPSTPFKETDLKETGITEIKANVGEEIANATAVGEDIAKNTSESTRVVKGNVKKIIPKKKVK